MLDEQTLKEFEMVVRRESEGSFFSFLRLGFCFLLAFLTASYCFVGIESELDRKLSLKAVGYNVRVFTEHKRQTVDGMEEK